MIDAKLKSVLKSIESAKNFMKNTTMLVVNNKIKQTLYRNNIFKKILRLNKDKCILSKFFCPPTMVVAFMKPLNNGMIAPPPPIFNHILPDIH